MSSLSVRGFWVGHMLLIAVQPLHSVRSAAELLLGKPGLIHCPVLGGSSASTAPPKCLCVAGFAEDRTNQTRGLNATSKESDESAFTAVLIFSLVPGYQLAGEREQIGAFGTLGVPSVCGWQAGVYLS